MKPLHTTSLSQFPLFRRGKVRDVYDLGNKLMMVATDRISAFDVVMNEAIPDKGALLTQISLHWFSQLQHIIPHHLISSDVHTVHELSADEQHMLEGRTMIVRKTNPLPVECVVRGYLAGSGWKEYQASRTVCGIALPDGLVDSSKLDAPIFTPATKAETGHDENIPFDVAVEILGEATATRVRDVSIALYLEASRMMEARGLILADTKFEFGVTDDGDIILIDEALTPDSSRYWLASEYAPGMPQQNFDKQILRDWLETCDWNKQAPPPTLPESVIEGTRAKYIEAFERITGRTFL
ncbi:phosphoribosylaminoimidazolesuccinocarboxamide synthase [soil metagenome]